MANDLALPLPDELVPDEAPASLSDIALDDAHMAYARERWPDKSESMQAYNVRRSIWGKLRSRQRHPDDPNRSVFGGPQPRSGPKTPNKAIGQALVEHVESRQKEVLDAAMAPLDPASGATAMERHKAALGLAKHAREEAREKRDADAFARLTDDEVRKSAAEEIVGMLLNEEISMDDLKTMMGGGSIIDAKAITPEQQTLQA